MKEELINTRLKFGLKGTVISARANIELFCTRMQTQINLTKEGMISADMIDSLDRIINDYNNLEKYIEVLKKASDEARTYHNRLYDEVKK